MPGSWDFSFSGLKTAVLYHVRDAGYTDQGRVRPAVPANRRMPRRFVDDLCASFQEAVVETLVAKSLRAALSLKVRTIVVGGGVAANRRLRSLFTDRAGKIKVHFPPADLCTDNAAMIAFVAVKRLRYGRRPRRFAVDPSMKIRSWRS